MAPTRRIWLVLGVVTVISTAILAIMSLKTTPTYSQLDFTYSRSAEGQVILAIQHRFPNRMSDVQVRTPNHVLIPTRKISLQTAPDGQGESAVEVPLDSPLSLTPAEVVFFPLATGESSQEITVSFVVDGKEKTEVHSGIPWADDLRF